MMVTHLDYEEEQLIEDVRQSLNSMVAPSVEDAAELALIERLKYK